MLENLQRLLDAVLKYLEILFLQILDEVALFIGDAGVQDDKPGVCCELREAETSR
jgi:hypothetical protein